MPIIINNTTYFRQYNSKILHSVRCICANMFNLSCLTFLRPTKIQLVVYSIIIAARNDAKLHLVCRLRTRFNTSRHRVHKRSYNKYLGAFLFIYFFFCLFVCCVLPIRTAVLVCLNWKYCWAYNLKFTSFWYLAAALKVYAEPLIITA